jgi:TetR/AcrR family transcriptional regulator, regulator of cefoperazone and chloramphenicol sensitivity
MSTKVEADDTPSKVLQAAGKIFAERGFDGATVRDICAAAGANLASVNYYFHDKETLYRKAVLYAHEQMVTRYPIPNWPAGMPAEDKLRGIIKTMLTRMLDKDYAPWTQQLMFREIMQPTEVCRDLVREYFGPHFELLNGVLSELLPAGFPKDRRHKIAFSIVGQCVYHRVGAVVVGLLISPDELNQSYSIEKLAEHIAEFSLAGIHGLNAKN